MVSDWLFLLVLGWLFLPGSNNGDSGYHGAVNQPAIKKVVYRGIAKNMHRFHMLFASANLIMCSRAGRTRDFIGCTV